MSITGVLKALLYFSFWAIGWWSNCLLICSTSLWQKKTTPVTKCCRPDATLVLTHQLELVTQPCHTITWARKDAILPCAQEVENWKYLVNGSNESHQLSFWSWNVYHRQNVHTHSLRDTTPALPKSAIQSWQKAEILGFLVACSSLYIREWHVLVSTSVRIGTPPNSET